MKKTISRQVLLIAVVNFWFIQSAAIEASIITDIAIGDEYLELEYDAGSGSSVSYVVVDLSNTGSHLRLRISLRQPEHDRSRRTRRFGCRR